VNAEPEAIRWTCAQQSMQYASPLSRNARAAGTSAHDKSAFRNRSRSVSCRFGCAMPFERAAAVPVTDPSTATRLALSPGGGRPCCRNRVAARRSKEPSALQVRGRLWGAFSLHSNAHRAARAPWARGEQRVRSRTRRAQWRRRAPRRERRRHGADQRASSSLKSPDPPGMRLRTGSVDCDRGQRNEKDEG